MSNIIDSIQLSGVTYTLSAQTSGEGKSVEAGRGISVASGTSAYTVSFNLPISAGTGSNSIAEGNDTAAIGDMSHAEGDGTIANGISSHAEGASTTASGICSHAEGYYTQARGNNSHAEGNNAQARGNDSHAEGYETMAAGNYSHAEGYQTFVSSNYSHAEGYNTTVDGNYSHAEGNYTIAINQSEHASGQYNVSNNANNTFGNSGNTLFSVGNGTSYNARHNAFEIRQNGDIYLSSGGTDIKLQDHLGGGGGNPTVELTQAEYDALVSGGTVDPTVFYIITDAQPVDISNYWTSAQTNSAITQATSGKVDTTTYNTYTAATDTALASKQTTLTAGTGIDITDNVISATGGGSSYTAGDGIDITNDVISVTGKVDTSTYETYTAATDTALGGKQATLVSGTNIKTINGETLLGEGNITIEGGSSVNVVQTTGTSTADVMSQNAVTTKLNTKLDVARVEPKTPTSNYTQLNLYLEKNGSGSQSLFTYVKTINGKSITSQNNDNLEGFSLIETSAITTSVTSSSTDAQVPSAKAVYDAIQEGGGGGGSSYSAGTNIDITNDIISCTLNASNGDGAYSFKEGWATYANNRCAHAEGEQTIASGLYSHAEGHLTTASSYYSHAEGYHTNANNQSEHASGQFNNSVSGSSTFGDSGNTLFSVGNGTADNARHNAFEIRQNGDIYLTKDGQDIKLQDQLGGSYVTTNTEQTISGRKIFTYSSSSGKAIEFKQTSNSAKVGFRIINSAATNNEAATFEFRPNTFTIDNVKHPLLYFGHYRNTSTANAGVPQTVIGYRQYDQLNAAAYHYLIPLPEKAKAPFGLTASFKDYYAPIGFKNGSTMITADNTGVVDLSSELGGLKLVKLTQAEYDALATKDNSTLYVIVN